MEFLNRIFENLWNTREIVATRQPNTKIVIETSFEPSDAIAIVDILVSLCRARPNYDISVAFVIGERDVNDTCNTVETFVNLVKDEMKLENLSFEIYRGFDENDFIVPYHAEDSGDYFEILDNYLDAYESACFAFIMKPPREAMENLSLGVDRLHFLRRVDAVCYAGDNFLKLFKENGVIREPFFGTIKDNDNSLYEFQKYTSLFKTFLYVDASSFIGDNDTTVFVNGPLTELGSCISSLIKSWNYAQAAKYQAQIDEIEIQLQSRNDIVGVWLNRLLDIQKGAQQKLKRSMVNIDEKFDMCKTGLPLVAHILDKGEIYKKMVPCLVNAWKHGRPVWIESEESSLRIFDQTKEEKLNTRDAVLSNLLKIFDEF